MLQQSKIVNVRVNPQIYELFKEKISQVGLKPSTFLKHVVISVALEEKTLPSLSDFLYSLPKNEISEKSAMNLAVGEKKAVYEAKSSQ